MWYLNVSIPDLCTLTYFNRVWHRGLIQFATLKQYNICGLLLNWFQSYLTIRFKRVVSRVAYQNGLIYWPVCLNALFLIIFFIMFLNNIVKESHLDIRSFADNTSLYISVAFPSSQIGSAEVNKV